MKNSARAPQSPIFKRFITLVLLIALSPMASLSSAHASEVRAYFDHLSIWHLPTVVVDGRSYETSFFSGYGDLEEAMRANPHASEYARLARVQQSWSAGLLLGSLSAAVGATVVAENGNDPSATLVVFLGTLLSSSFLQASSQVNTLRAINAYNGVRTSDHLELPSLHFVAHQGGAGGALSWNF